MPERARTATHQLIDQDYYQILDIRLGPKFFNGRYLFRLDEALEIVKASPAIDNLVISKVAAISPKRMEAETAFSEDGM